MNYMTVREVGTRLRVHRSTVERLIKDGKLSKVKVGRNVRIPVDSVAEYERTQTSPAHATQAA